MKKIYPVLISLLLVTIVVLLFLLTNSKKNCTQLTFKKQNTEAMVTITPTIIQMTPTLKPSSIPTPTLILTPTIDKEDVNRSCINADRYLMQIKEECGSIPFPGIEECIQMRIERAEVELKEKNLARANKMKELEPLYLQEKAKCS